MIRSLRFLCVAGLAAVVVSCPMPQMAGVTGPSAPSATGGAAAASVVTDAARNQAVFVDTNGTRVDIVSQEPDGSTVGSTQAAGLAVVSDSAPVTPAASGARGLSFAGVVTLRAIVVGSRSDDRGGAWVVLSNGIVLPAGQQSGSGTSSSLPDCDDAGHALRAAMGWTYTVTGISSDGRVIIGNAVNKNGFRRGGFTVDPGTTVGVYWGVARTSRSPFVSVGTARVIGTLNLSSLPPGHHGWWSRLSSWLQSRLSHLEAFFLGFFSSYLTSADAISYDSAQNLYSVTGTDQDGTPATATIDSRGAVTITPTSTPPAQPDLSTIQAVTNALGQCEAGIQGSSASGFTWTPSTSTGGSVVLSLQGLLVTASTEGTWGTLTFTNYVDAATEETLNGTLQVQVFQTGASTPLNGPVLWGASFQGLVDVTGTLTLSGSLAGSLACDFLATQNGTAMTLDGTVSMSGAYYNAATGAATSAPVPTVTFSPPSVSNYIPSVGSPLTLASTGSTAIYYTLDGSLPKGGSPTLYAGPITTSSISRFVVIAYAVNGTSQSRTSLAVYPGLP